MSGNPTYVYIDGFNLYYRRLHGTPFKWLDIGRMCDRLLPRSTVVKIKYFTAIVSARAHDPDKPMRQERYLRALRTDPRVEIFRGQFFTNESCFPIAGCLPDRLQMIRVTKTEEKESDVSLGAHLVHDAHLNRFQTGVVISADSDLAEPIRLVTREIGKPVGVKFPQRKRPQRLTTAATFYGPIRMNLVRASQFPHILSDDQGEFGPPDRWIDPAYKWSI
jgi:hypothetical protein